MAESQILTVFLLALSPIVECRGSIPYGVYAGLPLSTVLVISIIGNILPVPFLLLFLGKIENYIMSRSESNMIRRLYVKYINRLRAKTKQDIDRYGFLGLALFVAIPLPGTGAWTSSVIAHIFGIEKKRAFMAIAIGALGAIFIVTVLVLFFGIIL